MKRLRLHVDVLAGMEWHHQYHTHKVETNRYIFSYALTFLTNHSWHDEQKNAEMRYRKVLKKYDTFFLPPENHNENSKGISIF